MQTIGERLEEARKRKGVSIREAAEATKIRSDYLHKFESNSFDLDLPDIYARGFLRAYASYLKVPADKLVADFNSLASAGAETRGSRRESRETFGRMELAAQTAADDDAKPAPASPPPAPAAPPARPAPMRPMPLREPALNTAFLVKSGVIAVIAILLILFLVWGIKAIVGGGSGRAPRTAANPPAATQSATAAGQTITLVALDNVHVVVTQAGTQNVVFEGDLSRGETRRVPHTGPLVLAASNRAAVQFELNGQRYAIPAGYTSTNIP